MEKQEIAKMVEIATAIEDTANLINKLTELEIKACIYAERLGPNSPEVKALDKKIAELNTKLLDLMVEGQAG